MSGSMDEMTTNHEANPAAGTTASEDDDVAMSWTDDDKCDYGIKDQTLISDQELSECDREKLHLIGHIQGEAGHTLFISYPMANILGCDAMIHSVPWVRRRDVSYTNLDVSQKRPINAISQDESLSTENHAMSSSFTTGYAAAITSLKNASAQQLQQHQENAKALIGSSLQMWLPSDLFTKILAEVETMRKAKSTRSFLFYEHRRDAYAISISSSTRAFAIICIEVEQVESAEAAGEFYNTLVSLGRVMEFYADQKVIKNACDTVFNLLEHYDRGMVYRFNDDASGEIMHEIKKHNVASSYLGMRFPASDIPLSARQLYIKNGLRYIENADATDIPLITCEGYEEMDLSHCRMRAVAKPHLVYLRNMGVKCSLSMAIVVEGELWGLFAFHGYNRKYKPSLHQRIACETINSMVSVKVESMMKKEQSDRVIELSETMIKWVPHEDAASNLSSFGARLLHVLDVDVLVARLYDATNENPQIVVVGDDSLVPGDALWEHFAAKSPRVVYTANTRKSITEMSLSTTDCPASGIAYYRDGLVQVVLGRSLRAKDVVWAGNPDEPKLRIGGILCPRNSFDKFMEKARKESRAWSTSDIHVFEALMVRVCEHSHNRMMLNLKSAIEDANLKCFSAINRAKENCEFFAQMSHEIRTPFHGVMGCLNILNDSMSEMSEEEIQDLINAALSSGNQMINLLNDILNLSKNRHLSNKIAQDMLSYDELVNDAVQGIRSLAASKHIEFTCETIPYERNFMVITDKTKLFQIISNVVNNAIKFSSGKTVKVQLSLWESRKGAIEKWGYDASQYVATVCNLEENVLFHSVESAKRHVAKKSLDSENSDEKWMVTAVSDTGCGMRPNELAEMLQPYTQASRGSNRIFQGTGLGLFICVTLCHHLNGFLACSSTHGEGTVFHVGLPVKVEKAVANEALASMAVDGYTTSASAPLSSLDSPIPIRGPIVVCDDNVVNVKILKRGLEMDLKSHNLSQLEVLTAEGGLPLVSLYKQRHPSLLFVDYHMPDEDGSKATQRIRSYEAENEIPPAYIIIYTADLTEEAMADLRACGMNEVMTKPPPKGFIASVVKRIVVEAEQG